MKQLLSTLLLALLTALPATAQTDAPGWLSRATEAYTAGQLDSALMHVDRAIALDPGSALAFKLRGDIHQRQHQPELAEADYQRSEQLDDGNPRLYVSLSALQIAGGNAKGGLRYADKAIALDAKDADAWYNRAWALYQGNDLDLALKSVRQALELVPQFPEALYLSGVIKGARYDEKAGVEEISEALRLNPAIPGGLMSKAVLQYEAKAYQDAITTFSEVIASDTTELADAFYYRADCHYNLGDKESACADWQRSLSLGDKDAAFIKRNYCDTDANKIPKKPVRKRRRTTIEF
ncbi:MAG: tetratricopeptide repeat protein [Flavobacteriales bacterium]|nr:tetratricopeptide repeat protein [Flavobacteriales bacterium]MCL4281416.1 tetratricopeptide repeat protein [Flavobacteriales bacterium]